MSENFLAQLKAVVDPLTVFSHYITLKKAGNRYRSLCPFHSEKTPSFYAGENGMFHCFGCGLGGDVIKFVMLMEKMDFKECIQLLSQRYGIPLKFASTGERKEKEELLDLMRQASDFYHNLLTTHASGRDALDYLEQRGVSRETVRKFHLGWAPNAWSSLLEHFQKRDVQPALLEKCGLIVPRQTEGYYDRYRSRIMIPIHDIHGNIIGLGGRIFQGSGEEAKYMNSPETPLYSKSNQLFGLYLSKDAIQNKKFAILVEGYFDMIMPYQAGHDNIIASLGTSLTENQAKLLRRYCERIVIFYDPDTAGRNATLRALPILLKEGFFIQAGRLPEGQDPDQFIREKGAGAFQSEIDRALSYDQLFLQTLAEKHDWKTPGGKLAAADELIGLLSSITNPFEREQVMNRFASSTGISTQVLQDLYRRRQRGAAPSPATRTEMQKIPEPERHLLRIFLSNQEIAALVFPEMDEQDFDELVFAEIFRQFEQKVLSEEREGAAHEILRNLPPETQNFLTSLILDNEAPDPNIEDARHWVQAIRQGRTERILRQMNLEIEEAKKAPETDKLDEVLRQKLDLARQTPKVARRE